MAGQIQLESRKVVVDWTNFDTAQAGEAMQRYADYRQWSLKELDTALAKQATLGRGPVGR
jgi:hypothetical protein